MAKPATSIVFGEKGPIENILASVLLAFGVRKFKEQNALFYEIALCGYGVNEVTGSTNIVCMCSRANIQTMYK